jgi:hypothetical protein
MAALSAGALYSCAWLPVPGERARLPGEAGVVLPLLAGVAARLTRVDAGALLLAGVLLPGLARGLRRARSAAPTAASSCCAWLPAPCGVSEPLLDSAAWLLGAADAAGSGADRMEEAQCSEEPEVLRSGCCAGARERGAAWARRRR